MCNANKTHALVRINGKWQQNPNARTLYCGRFVTVAERDAHLRYVDAQVTGAGFIALLTCVILMFILH